MQNTPSELEWDVVIQQHASWGVRVWDNELAEEIGTLLKRAEG